MRTFKARNIRQLNSRSGPVQQLKIDWVNRSKDEADKSFLGTRFRSGHLCECHTVETIWLEVPDLDSVLG